MAESDEQFLRSVLEDLERLRGASRQRGHPLLASIIDLAVAEAQDDLRTQAIAVRRFSEFRDACVSAADLFSMDVG